MWTILRFHAHNRVPVGVVARSLLFNQNAEGRGPMSDTQSGEAVKGLRGLQSTCRDSHYLKVSLSCAESNLNNNPTFLSVATNLGLIFVREPKITT